MLSKNFLPARYAKLPAVHGVFDRSISIWISPRLETIVMICLPLRGTSAWGLPTSTMPDGVGSGEAAGDALGSMSGL